MANTNHVDEELEALLDDGRLEPIPDIIERISGRRQDPSTTWRHVRKGTGPAGPLPARLVLGKQCSTESCVREWLRRRSQYRPRRCNTPKGPSDEELKQRGLLVDDGDSSSVES